MVKGAKTYLLNACIRVVEGFEGLRTDCQLDFRKSGQLELAEAFYTRLEDSLKQRRALSSSEVGSRLLAIVLSPSSTRFLSIDIHAQIACRPRAQT
jgi:hypothetical protein